MLPGDQVCVLVQFVLLQLNTVDEVIYNKQKFIGSWFYRLKVKIKGQASGEGCLTAPHGRRAKKRQEGVELTLL